MKIRKKLLSILLTAALVLSLMPAVTLTASATTYDGEYNINNWNISISNAGTYRIYGDGLSTVHSIYLSNVNHSSGVINITLENVYISPDSGISFVLESNTMVKLTLVGTNIIKGTTYNAGILLGESSTLIITKESTGSLDVTGGDNSAGIGGNYTASCSQGTLVIEGGTVTAQGGMYAPGIGGGLTLSHNSTSGPVIITGGTVTATGGRYAAGIGTSGYDDVNNTVSGAGMVYISGGTVTATGGTMGGAGIGGGGGYCSCAGYINISGGTVTATGGAYGAYAASYSGAGIGGGSDVDASVLTISGGVVTAIGGWGSVPGIGGGYSSSHGAGDGGLITITGGTVTSLRKDGTPDIGTGCSTFTVTSASEGSLYISGGSVNAGFEGTVYASNESTLPLYLTTVTGLPFSTAVTYSIDGGDSASCNTDGNGKLYLWLPESAETTVEITAGYAEYAVSGAVSSTEANSFAAAAVAHTASGAGAYSLAAVASTAYTTGATDANLPTMTVNSDVSGFTYFEVSVYALGEHAGSETAVFVLTRGGQQIAINATTADFDTVDTAKAGFNVKAGDVVTVYIVDSLTNGSGTSPTVL